MEQNPSPARSRSKARYIVLTVLIVLVALAILFLPRYNRYLKQKRADEIRTALEAVRQAVDARWKSQGSISGITLEQILQDAKISPKLLTKWQFAIAWKNTEIYTAEMVEKLKDVSTNQTVYVAPYRIIMAYATKRNPLPEGTKVWYVGDTDSYHGFGIDDQIEPDWKEIFPNP